MWPNLCFSFLRIMSCQLYLFRSIHAGESKRACSVKQTVPLIKRSPSPSVLLAHAIRRYLAEEPGVFLATYLGSISRTTK